MIKCVTYQIAIWSGFKKQYRWKDILQSEIGKIVETLNKKQKNSNELDQITFSK